MNDLPSSAVGQVKELYLRATRRQRQMIRAFFQQQERIELGDIIYKVKQNMKRAKRVNLKLD